MFSKITIYLLIFVTIIGFVLCTPTTSSSDKESSYKNLDDSVDYVGMETCRLCHSEIHASFIHTGMGKSFDRATREKSDARFHKEDIVYDEVLDFYYKPYFKGETFFIQEFRLEGKDTVHSKTQQIDYIIGSGQHTNSHMFEVNGYLHQAPITFYTQSKKWDLAPGYEQGGNERFDRIIESECLTCHNHFPKPVPGSINKYYEVPSGIECERCHGPGGVHVAEKSEGIFVDTSKYIDYSIVNPRDLEREYQMDLCQRCHLQGVAVPHKDKDFYDFKPGMRLKEVMNVFLPRFTDSHESFIMASQADRLVMSTCYLESEMSCLTCHNPHISIENTSDDVYNNACQSCHKKEDDFLCKGDVEGLGKCVDCHMPKSGSLDIPHVNITDHYISTENVPGLEPVTEKVDEEKISAFLGLEILTKKNPTPLEMAQGYLVLYDKFYKEDKILDSIDYFLSLAEKGGAFPRNERIHLAFIQEDYAGILSAASSAKKEDLSAWSAYRVGEAFMKRGETEKAIPYLETACEQLPFYLEFQEKRGLAYAKMQSFADAKKVFDFVLEENPNRKVALNNLGYIHFLKKEMRSARKYYEKALDNDPDYIPAMKNKALLFLQTGKEEEAKGLLKKVQTLDPNDKGTKRLLESL